MSQQPYLRLGYQVRPKIACPTVSPALPKISYLNHGLLGTDRPTVSLAAGVLQRKELIEYSRGAVKIVNRKKLEDSACECYGVVQQYNGELGLK